MSGDKSTLLDLSWEESLLYCNFILLKPDLAGSDAKSVILYSSDELMKLVEDQGQKFAFDHREILKNFFKEKSNDVSQR